MNLKLQYCQVKEEAIKRSVANNVYIFALKFAYYICGSDRRLTSLFLHLSN
ncbi:MAG: hypothetical protein AAFY50_03605 [Cyanobacteria bacterium J06648_1]